MELPSESDSWSPEQQHVEDSVASSSCMPPRRGQVTIFTISGCPHCIRLKALLDWKEYSFVEIDLALFPEKRAGMILLSSTTTVPQLFFNNYHVGSADEVEELEAKGELSALYDLFILQNDFSYKFPPPTIATQPTNAPVTPGNEVPGSGAADSTPFPVDDIRPGATQDTGDGSTAGLSAFLVTAVSCQGRGTPRLQERDPLYNGVYELKEHGEVRVYSYADLVRRLLGILSIKERRKSVFQRSIRRRCFYGDEAVSCFVKAFGLQSREEAVQLGNTLMEANVFQQISQSVDAFRDQKALYRLQYHEDVHILNTAMVWTQSPAPSFSVLQYIDSFLLDLEEQYTNRREGSVDCVGISQDRKFLDFQVATCELQQIDMLRECENARLAFFINVYNLAVKHALVQLGVPVDNLARLRFFGTVGYCVGGFRYTLNDMEHGILRGNKRPPYSLSKPFRFKDQREDLMIKNFDVRIHFALNCGASSCPPIRFYTAENIQEELRVAAEAFCEDSKNVWIDVAEKTIFLSKIFHWYYSDFWEGAGFENPEGVLKLASWCSPQKRAMLEQFVRETRGKKIRVKFTTYDWSPKKGTYRSFKK